MVEYRFSFQGAIPLNPPFVACFGILPELSLSSNGRLSMHPCTRGAYKGIHALASVATCQLSQPKQMRRSGYLHLIGLNSICCFVLDIEKTALAVFTALQRTTQMAVRRFGGRCERPVEDGNNLK